MDTDEQRVCERCNSLVAEEDFFAPCEHCGRMIGPCCLSAEIEGTTYCDDCERKTRDQA